MSTTPPGEPAHRGHRVVEELAADAVRDDPASTQPVRERHLTPVNLLLIITSVSIAACGQLLLRHGMRLAKSQAGASGSLVMHAVTSPSVIGGLAVFGLSAILWLATLSRVPLSVAYPFNALGYLGILTLSALVLHEHVPTQTWVGSVVVVAGLLLVVTSAGVS